jgi:SnoaL-like polyketide cyclase
MSVALHKAIARRSWEAWETGNLALVDDMGATDYVFPNAAGGVVHGRDHPKRGIMSCRIAFPDLPFLLEPVCAGEDKVTVRRTAHGTHCGGNATVRHRLGGVWQESQQIPPDGETGDVEWHRHRPHHGRQDRGKLAQRGPAELLAVARRGLRVRGDRHAPNENRGASWQSSDPEGAPIHGHHSIGNALATRGLSGGRNKAGEAQRL